MRKSTSFDTFIEGTYQEAMGWGVVLLRIVIGFLFFYAGWSKLVSPDWSAAGYLANATGPFASWFQSLAGNGFIDFLNMWGLTLIGVALIIGLLVRTASAFGIVIMVLYYFADLVGNTAHGFIDEHVVYATVLLLFILGGFGHVWGVDSIIERRLAPRMKWVRLFLG